MSTSAGERVADGEHGWRRLSRRSLWASAVKSLAIVAGATAGLVRFLTEQDWTFAGIAAACAGAAVLIVLAVVAYDAARLRASRWRLTPERLELLSGVTTRRHRSIPRERVRSVDLRADPVNRMFGLTVVKVGTGEHAGDDTELALDPLARHEAEALRRTLLRQEEDAPERGPLAELRWSWLRYAPLSVWTFTGAAVVLGALYKVFTSFGAKSLATRAATALWEWIAAQPLLAVPLLLVVNTAVGVLGAALLFAESWGRYRLDREPGRLRLRRGLLTTRSLTLEERRLRGVEVGEPLLLRLGGAARVRAIATGLGEAAEGETEDVAALAPPLPRPLAARLATAIAGEPLPGLTPGSPPPAPAVPHGRTQPPPATRMASDPASRHGRGEPRPSVRHAPEAVMVPHPPAARRRRMSRAVVGTALTAVAAGVAWWALPWQDVRTWVWLVPAAVLVAGLWAAVTSAASLGHALGVRHLVTRRGAVVRRTVALERRGISGWTFTESYFQRRSGLLTVSATTAAGRGHYEVVDVGRGDGLDLAARAVPGLLDPFVLRPER